MSSSKAFSFGISREAFNKVYIPARKASVDHSVPGPGKYSTISTIGKDAKKISI